VLSTCCLGRGPPDEESALSWVSIGAEAIAIAVSPAIPTA
jgi:hypothetical protein